ncbi:hypothetical protein [Paramicrobacterium agarici]|nr:hypothetical protein [Microbacterium agarici]
MTHSEGAGQHPSTNAAPLPPAPPPGYPPRYGPYPPPVRPYAPRVRQPSPRMHPLRICGIVATVLGFFTAVMGGIIVVLPYGLFLLGGGGNVDAFYGFADSFKAPGLTVFAIGAVLLVLGIVGIITGKSRPPRR